MFELTVITGPDKGQVYRSRADEATLGRDENIEMSLSDRSSSRKHARIAKRGRYYEIEDLHSGNGTTVNARRINMPTQLHPGDLIVIGNNTIRFHLKDESPRSLASENDYLMTATITMRDLQRELAAQRGGDVPEWDPAHRAQQDMAAIFRSGQALNGIQMADELHPRVIEVILAELPRADRASIILSEG